VKLSVIGGAVDIIADIVSPEPYLTLLICPYGQLHNDGCVLLRKAAEQFPAISPESACLRSVISIFVADTAAHPMPKCKIQKCRGNRRKSLRNACHLV
jgi:hypothetical protein